MLENIKNLGNLMKQAQKVQEEMAKIQEELSKEVVEGSSPAGDVKVWANGQGEVVKVSIPKTAVKSGDNELLEDMVLMAVRDALKKSRDIAQEKMSKLTGGINIPGLFP